MSADKQERDLAELKRHLSSLSDRLFVQPREVADFERGLEEVRRSREAAGQISASRGRHYDGIPELTGEDKARAECFACAFRGSSTYGLVDECDHEDFDAYWSSVGGGWQRMVTRPECLAP